MYVDAQDFYYLVIYLFWLLWVLVVACRIFCCGACGLLVSARGLLSSCGARAQQLQHTGSVVAAHGLSCPVACGILVPRPEI